MDENALAKLAFILPALEQAYGRQTRYSTKSPMDQVIATILSQRTNYQDEKTAYDNLLQRFGNWEGVAAAPALEIEAAIQTSRYPEVKAPRIKQVLQQIIAEHGQANLDFLADWPVEQAQAYLMQLPGVGFKTATFTLLFSLRKPVLPVDTHVHRVSVRTGILPPKTSAERAHILLLELLPREADELLNFHKLLFKHGQRICTWHQPKCGQCIIRSHCDYYARVEAKSHQEDGPV